MRLDLGPLDRLPAERPFAVEGEVEAMTVGGETVEFSGRVTAKGRVERIRGGARLVGEVVAPVRLRCGRCLDRFETTLRGRLDVVLEGPGGEPDEDSVPYREQLDLTPAVDEAIVLELPVRALCQPECQGLCPQCGARREDGCACEPEGDPRLAMLADWVRGRNEGGKRGDR